MASIKDVAKDAGVSIATVSYVINKNKYVSPEYTKKVMDSIKKLNYNVSPVARSLRNRKTNTIGVVLQNITNIFFPELLAGLEEFARSKNYSLLFSNSYDDIEIEKNDITTLQNMWVDGIILDSCVLEKKIEMNIWIFLKQIIFQVKKYRLYFLREILGAKNTVLL